MKYKIKSKKGFSFAEVLMTLLIVGILATLTIPNAVGSYDKTTNLAKAKETYSTLSNVFINEIRENGSLGLSSSAGNFTQNDNNIYNALTKHVRFSAIYRAADNGGNAGDHPTGAEYYSLDGTSVAGYPNTNYDLYVLPSGIEVHVHSGYSPDSGDVYGIIFIDTNGYKNNPNTFGRDVFIATVYSRTGMHTGTTIAGTCDKDAGNLGFNCLDVIAKNSWDYPDDYPY